MADQKLTRNNSAAPSPNGDLENAGKWVAILCACALGPTGLELLIEILPERGLNEAAFKAMFQVFLLSAPLVIAVGFTALALMRDWFSPDNPGGVWWLLFGVWIVTFILSNVGMGIGPVKYEDVVKVGFPQMRIIFNILVGYFKAYGPLLFISAVALGIWLAAATNKHKAGFLRELENEFKNT